MYLTKNENETYSDARFLISHLDRKEAIIANIKRLEEAKSNTTSVKVIIETYGQKVESNAYFDESVEKLIDYVIDTKRLELRIVDELISESVSSLAKRGMNEEKAVQQ